MTNYRFERECRTPYSEAYNIFYDDRPMGRVDIHFTSNAVHGTLCVLESVTEDELEELIETVDEDVVTPADVNRSDFVVVVYRGRNLGTYSDDDFEDEALAEDGQNGH